MTETEQQASAQDAENKVTLPFIITNEKQSLIAVSHSSHFVVFQSSTGNQLWQHDFPTDITAAQFSNSGDMIAVACEDKNIHVFSKGKNESSLFVEIANSCSRKKISCVAFSNDESELWFGDKFGDVHSIPTTTTTTTTDNVVVIKNPELRLGHVSLLTDMKMSFDGKYVITADRDEKIRISNFPNSYEIHQFCLGHKELVLWIQLLNNELMVSAGADATIRLWSIEHGTCLCTLSTKNAASEQEATVRIPSSCAVVSPDRFWVSFEGSSSISLYEVQNGKDLVEIDTKNVGSTVFSLAFTNQQLMALVSEEPHLRNLTNTSAVDFKVSLTVGEVGGKSSMMKTRDAKYAKKPRLE